MNQLVRKQYSSACVSMIRSDPNAKDRRIGFARFEGRALCIFSRSKQASLRHAVPYPATSHKRWPTTMQMLQVQVTRSL
jgi:hypothetical protein